MNKLKRLISIIKIGNSIGVKSAQKALLHKIKAYRDDCYGVAHAGNSGKPKELDVIWYIDTVSAQIIYLDKKIETGK